MGLSEFVFSVTEFDTTFSTMRLYTKRVFADIYMVAKRATHHKHTHENKDKHRYQT